MATRNLNYFGTFVDTMKSQTPSSRDRRLSDWEPAQISNVSDPFNEVVKALSKKDGLGAKELVPITGYSISTFFEAADRLAKAGLVIISPTYTLNLTDNGRELAKNLK